MTLGITAGKRITLVFGKLNIVFHEESSILAEKTQSAGIANSLTGDTLPDISGENSGQDSTLDKKMNKTLLKSSAILSFALLGFVLMSSIIGDNLFRFQHPNLYKVLQISSLILFYGATLFSLINLFHLIKNKVVERIVSILISLIPTIYILAITLTIFLK